MLKYLTVVLVGVILTCKAENLRYDNYTLYYIQPIGDQMKVLQNLRSNDVRYDFWSEPMPIKEFVNILSSPKHKRDLEDLLNENGIKFDIATSNIQDLIDEQTFSPKTSSIPGSMTWDTYHTNDQINSWLDMLIANYTEVSSLIIGNSYEGRPIRGVKLSHGGDGEKRAIFLEGGIHAREWISPAVVCFILNELLTSDYELTKAAAREYDWYIFPVTNPDGYVWSHESNRLWRKNRRPFGPNFGVDLNRNWNNNWMVVGASSRPSADTYAGPGPFSEPETLHLSRFISSVGSSLDMYLTFHSYGQMLLIPFGNTTQPLANYAETRDIGRRAMGALSVKYGTQYVTGNSAEVIYLASGAADDWVKERIKVPIVYCYELRPTSGLLSPGFLLPPAQILASGEETLDSILELIHQGRRFGVIPGPSSSGASGLSISAFMMLLVMIVRL